MKLLEKKEGQFISQVVILSMIFGFGAGIVGQIVADVYIDPWQQDYYFTNQNLNTNSLVIPELGRVNKFLGIEQDFEVNKSVSKVSPGLAGVYLKKSATNNILNQIYLPKDLEANGFILTSDGWLVSYGEIFDNVKTDQLIVVYDNKELAIEDLITDTTTGVVFIKISANNLPVVVLGDSNDIVLGQLTLTLNSLKEVNITNIKNNNYHQANLASDLIITSEEYRQSFLLNESLDNTYLGSPLVNLGGEVVGVISRVDVENGITTVVPINQFRSIILDVLRSKIVKRPFLGVDYIDLAWTTGLNRDLTQGLDKGALVYQNPKASTPAREGEILEDDIIVSVDGQPVDKDSSLTTLIQQYQPGDEVSLEILRDGKTFDRTVTLVILQD